MHYVLEQNNIEQIPQTKWRGEGEHDGAPA